MKLLVYLRRAVASLRRFVGGPPNPMLENAPEGCKWVVLYAPLPRIPVLGNLLAGARR